MALVHNTYTQTENESFKAARNYSLDLQKGWNLIEYHITEIFEESSGKIILKLQRFNLLKIFLQK